MPPLTLLGYEPDGDGGWVVAWRDESNIGGRMVQATYHLVADRVADLEVVRGQTGSPPTEMVHAIETTHRDRAAVRAGRELEIPEGVVPYAIRDWLEGYEEHLRDCVDRVELNVAGYAPYGILKAARAGAPVPPRFKRRREGESDAQERLRRLLRNERPE